MPIRLHAIAVADAQNGTSTSEYPVSGIVPMFVPFRDLCAVVSEQKAFCARRTDAGGDRPHRAVVDAVFRRAAVLPAPVGVVFRAPDVLKRWMELHYVSLTDALEFVEDRAVRARAHRARRRQA